VSAELVLLSRVCCRGQEITRPRLRWLFALLADDLRTGCGTARLVEALWPDERPANPAKALQVLVSQARAQLGPDVIASTPAGYRLALREDAVDAAAVLVSAAASARHARAGDHAAALAHAETGLAWWDGPPDVDTDPADPLAALRSARASTYRSLVRERALALSRLGRRAEALEPLTELAVERSRDEEVLAELLRCEEATLGPSSALARYDAYRRALRDELGTDPGPALQALHRQLLQGDLPPVRRGVRHEPNPLLGRDEDIAAVTDLLRTARVTSIVGAGGLGKTRLAHVLGRRAEQRVVHFVELAGVATDADVVHQVASALEVGDPGLVSVGRPAAHADLLAGVVAALGPGPALLVLDNCEHVVDGVADLVRGLVSASEDLRVLTTSRAPLGLSSESVYLLPELSARTAVELFGQRARAARPDADLPEDVVAEVCGHLDGLPLAVELAAARVRVMSVAEIAGHLDDRFALLRGGSRDAPPRHRTLHAVIDWSWHLLDPAAQAAMRALSVFPGGFTAQAARHLLGGDALPVVERLVDQSLLKVSDTETGARFRMLETVREFSTAHREEAGETGEVADRFRAWARDLGMAHHESVFSAELVLTVALLRAEQDNLVQALRYGMDAGDGATVAATSAVLGGLWVIESNFARMATLGEEPARVLSHFRPGPAHVEVTRTAAVLTAVSALLLRAPGLTRSLVTLLRLPPGPPDSMSRAMETVLRAVTGVPTADPRSLDELCDAGESLLAGLANGVTSYTREQTDDLDGALTAAKRMLAAFDDLGIPALLATAHARIGELCMVLDRPDEARRHIGATLSVVEEIGAWSTAVRARWVIVFADLQRGAVDEAEHGLAEVVRAGGDEALGMAMFDAAVRAEILLARGQADAGLRLWRRVTDRLRHDASRNPGSAAWRLEAQAVAVVAHAHHGRLDLVEDITAELPGLLSAMVEPGSATDFPLCGAVLLALAMTDIDRDDPHARRSGARMIALAERLRFSRGFQPTMSSASATQVAEQADRPAYLDAVATYAGVAPEALRATVSSALLARAVVMAPGPA
jgi:predicted ATPase/DNA-binding SARP family transcriptional activator